MYHRLGSSLVQVMPRDFSAKPFPNAVMTYLQWDHRPQRDVTLILKVQFPNIVYRFSLWAFFVNLFCEISFIGLWVKQMHFILSLWQVNELYEKLFTRHYQEMSGPTECWQRTWVEPVLNVLMHGTPLHKTHVMEVRVWVALTQAVWEP